MNDLAAHERLAHTLRDASASLGAMRVNELAETLELAIRHQASRDEIEPDCAALSSELSVLIEAVGTVLSETREE